MSLNLFYFLVIYAPYSHIYSFQYFCRPGVLEGFSRKLLFKQVVKIRKKHEKSERYVKKCVARRDF